MEQDKIIHKLHALVNRCKDFSDECNSANAIVDTNNKDAMLQQILSTSRDCYLVSIEERYLHKFVASASFKTKFAGVPFICVDAKEFAGLGMTPLTRLLAELREDCSLLLLLVNAIDSMQEQDEVLLNVLAEDIIENLFADFTSVEENVSRILRHLEFLFNNTHTGLTAAGAVFESTKFLNKLVKAFLQRPEHRQYLAMLFKPTLEEFGQKFLSAKMLDNGGKEFESPAGEIMRCCEKLVEAIVAKLEYMPVGIRYLAKIIKDKLEVIYVITR
eukprot:TRINITY_DN9762_c0_g1_i14.p2 TRINITY_DN9762_c0_g1~~TRINITY_DN9762_c0_g1_i14.p2  ORF type:complete len:273 (+),score=59.82 TRINITY_DN9762_c0_g1_i14:163-981(+)